MLDATTGKILGSVGRGSACLPYLNAFSGDTVYCPRSPQGMKLSDAVSGARTRSKKKGRPAYFKNLVLNAPLVCGNMKVVVTGRGTVEAYQLPEGTNDEPGKLVWEWKSPRGAEISTAPAAGSGFIVVGSDDGHVYGFSYSDK